MIEPNARAYNVNPMFNFTKCRFDIFKLKCYIIKFRVRLNFVIFINMTISMILTNIKMKVFDCVAVDIFPSKT